MHQAHAKWENSEVGSGGSYCADLMHHTSIFEVESTAVTKHLSNRGDDSVVLEGGGGTTLVSSKL